MYIHKHESTLYTHSERANAITYADTLGVAPQAPQAWEAVDRLVAKGGSAEAYLAGPRLNLDPTDTSPYRTWLLNHSSLFDQAIRARILEQQGFEPFRAEALQVRQRWLKRGELPLSYRLIESNASRFVATFPDDAGQLHTLTAYLPYAESDARRVDAHFLPYTAVRSVEMSGAEQGVGIAYEGLAVAKTPQGEPTTDLSIEQIGAISNDDLELTLDFLDDFTDQGLALSGLSRAYYQAQSLTLAPFTFTELRAPGGLAPISNIPRLGQLIFDMGRNSDSCTPQERLRAVKGVLANLIEVGLDKYRAGSFQARHIEDVMQLLDR